MTGGSSLQAKINSIDSIATLPTIITACPPDGGDFIAVKL